MHRVIFLYTMESSFLFLIWLFSSTAVGIIRGAGAFVSRERVLFLREPVDQVVTIGSDLEIPCSVLCDNGRCLFITWTQNGALVTFDERVYKDSDGSLILNGVRKEDEGVYQCVIISPSYGVFLSQRAVLNIARIGELTQNTEDVIDAVPGGAARFQCLAATALPTPNVTWYHDGTLINGDSSESKRIVLPSGVLQISSLRDSDAGVYSCSVSNIAGTIWGRNATLNVSQAASVSQDEVLKIVHAPESVTVSRGNEAVFECLVQMARNVLWKRIDESPLSRKAYVSGGNLIIPNVTSSDEGTYACIAQNSGKAQSLLANLTVHWPPRIVKAPEETRRFRGESWRLNCYTQANPMPNITWYKNGERLRSHGRIKMFPNELQPPSILEKPSGGIEYVRDLLVTSIEKDDAGVYQCFAENYLGSATAAAAMLYQEIVVLDGPFNLSATVLPNQRELEITWNLPPLELSNRSVVFIVHFHESESGSENTMAVKHDACNAETCKTICCSNINLQPFTNYTFWVDALLDYHQTPPKFTSPSERITVTTGDATVSAAAPLLLQETAETYSVLLTWRKPSMEPVNGDVVGYRIEMKTESKPGSKELVWWRQPRVVPPSTNQFTVRNLDPALVLYFRVIAATRAGYPTAYTVTDFPLLRYSGNRTRIASDNASDLIPDEAPTVDARGVNCSSIFVQWAPPSDRRKRSEDEAMTKWVILASRPTDGSPLARADVPFRESSVVLFGLNAGTLYQITVYVLKSAGSEGLRAITLAKTATSKSDDRPPPGALARIVVPYPIPNCVPAGPGRLRVQWEKPPMVIVGVTLRYSLVPTDLNEPLNVSANVKKIETSSDSLVFTDLLPGRIYLFAARAQTEYGYTSVYSHDINCSVPLARPDAPPHVEAAIANGSLVVWWMPVASVSEADQILLYHVKYTCALEENGWEEISVPGTNTSVILHNQTVSSYFVTVTAENSVGRGRESAVKAVGTDASYSGGRRALHASHTSISSSDDATVVLQISYKEGVIIGVSIGILCAIVSGFILIFRSRRDSDSCAQRLLCHRRSGVKISSSGCYTDRQDGRVACVELKEMQTLLPQLMENADSDSKGADIQTTSRKISSDPFSLRPSSGQDNCESVDAWIQSQWSQGCPIPLVEGSGNLALPVTRIPANGLTGSGRSTENGCLGPVNGECLKLHRAASSLPNLPDLEELRLLGNRVNGHVLPNGLPKITEGVDAVRAVQNGNLRNGCAKDGERLILGDLDNTSISATQQCC